MTDCPSCGGAGGGPVGRAGSAWDDEGYTCPRCEGVGAICVITSAPRPGITKAAPTPAEIAEEQRKATG